MNPIPPQFWKGMGITPPRPEFRFHPQRRWRFDYAWPTERLAVEIEGGAYTRGRHTRGAGFVNDMEKYNMATVLGWHILRYTPTGINYDQIRNMLIALRSKQESTTTT